MIAQFIIVLFILSVIHYLYENCILPELHIEFQYQIFALRDKLRLAKAEARICDMRAFYILEGSLNNAVNAIPVADYRFMTEMRDAMAKNRGLAAETAKRVKILEGSTDDIIRDVHRRSQTILQNAFYAGAGALFLYLIPLVVGKLLCSKVRKIAGDALAMPSPELGVSLGSLEPVSVR